MANQRTSPLVWLGIALVLATTVIGIYGVLSWSTYGPSAGGYYGMMGGGSGGWIILMMGIPVAILVGALVLVLVGLGESTRPTPPVPPPATPLEILDARYARNEISREDYLRIQADLTGKSGRPL